MAEKKKYRIKGASVLLTSQGRMSYFYPPSLVPDDVPQHEIDHNMEVGLLEEVGDLYEPAAPGALGQPLPVVPDEGDPGKADGGREQQRAQVKGRAQQRGQSDR